MAHFRVRLLRLALPFGDEARAGPDRDATGPGRRTGPDLCSAMSFGDEMRIGAVRRVRPADISGSVRAHLRTEPDVVALLFAYAAPRPTRRTVARVHHACIKTGASLLPRSLLDTRESDVLCLAARASGWLLYAGAVPESVGTPFVVQRMILC
ncbi:hypothetical protein HPB50_000640 [Hyalomma asiaticum]|uniref:Uncharacterized protein n=1 Tax=Hyalomma asiaticum TaxID=266040 RepID=A0ACB7TCT1_HYAAI|nr:hypothetical protein HPB50_000640 [Hyalomma asiaticum]